jgi:hypothetical protein
MKRNKWDERASDNYRKFMLEEECKEEMLRRKTQYTNNNRTWSIISTILFTIISAAVLYAFVVLYMIVFID